MSKISKKAEGNPEWQNFESAMRKLVQVPYSTVKADLEAENKIRRRKRTRSAKVRAFRASNSNDQIG